MSPFNKIVFAVLAVTLIGCSSSKSLVRTSKTPSKTSSSQMAHHHHAKPKSSAVETQAPDEVIKPSEVIVSTSKTVVTSEVIKGYVFQYKDIAMNNMKNYGIPASIILAQGILESGAGKGDLALSANNHFGIKCHAEWTGDSVKHDDDLEQECFRKYVEPAESYKDHALFLTGRPRYANLFALPKGDYKAWAKMLRADGYATDPKYPDKLIGYIEKYNLHQYDTQVLAANDFQNVKPVMKQANPVSEEADLYEVKKGDTLYSISKKFNVTVEQLRQKNNFSPSTALSIGQKLKV